MVRFELRWRTDAARIAPGRPLRRARDGQGTRADAGRPRHARRSGIGANTAIFSVINALLLRPLPYAEPERLVMVWQDLRARGGPATEWTGPSQQFDWKAQTDVFESLTSIRGWNASLAGGDMPEVAAPASRRRSITSTWLGTRPALGRAFADCRRHPERAARGDPQPRPVDAALRRRIRGVIGQSISINGESHEVIGVMPAGSAGARCPTPRCGGRMRLRPRQSVAQRGRLPHLRAAARRRDDRSGAGALDLLAKQLAAGASAESTPARASIPCRCRNSGRRHEAVAVHAARRGRLRAADRLRQHRQPAALARVRTQRARWRCGARSAPIGCASSASC